MPHLVSLTFIITEFCVFIHTDKHGSIDSIYLVLSATPSSACYKYSHKAKIPSLTICKGYKKPDKELGQLNLAVGNSQLAHTLSWQL